MSHFLSCGAFRRGSLPAGLVLGAVLLSPGFAWAEIVKVKVTGVRGAAGLVRCGLYASADGFRVPGREAFEAESAIRNGQAACSFDKVPSGRYALAVFHAEKRENQIEYGMFGKPRQGVGFSQNPSITFGAPGFDKAAFSVGKGQVDLSVALQY